MKKLLAFIPLLAIAATSLATEPTTPAESADAVLKKAQAEAKAQKKNVLVKFSASWCGWCHRLDDFLTKTDIGKKVKSQYVVVTLIVNESADHKDLENPGGLDVLAKLGGADSGIPYFAVMDPSGKTLINSNPNKEKPGNVGFPVEDFEIAHFMKMLKTTSKLTEKELAEVDTWFKANAKKIKGGGLN